MLTIGFESTKLLRLQRSQSHIGRGILSVNGKCTATSPKQTFALLIQAAAFLSLTVFVFLSAPSWFARWNSIDAVGRILALEILICFVAIVLALAVYLRHRDRSRLLTFAMWTATTLVWLLLIMPYGAGGLQDLLHVHCDL